MLKILKKLRTASLKSEVTGSYKKSVSGNSRDTWQCDVPIKVGDIRQYTATLISSGHYELFNK